MPATYFVDASGASFTFTKMVELVGTAPTSAGLSWLVVYRHSSFWKS